MSAPVTARRELERLVAALGHAVEGGDVSDAAVLWPLEPQGGLAGARLLLRLDRFPLPERVDERLRDAGYSPVGDADRYLSGRGVQLGLCAIEDDADPWRPLMALRDELRRAPEPSPDAYDDPERVADAAARRWRTLGFAPLLDLARELAGVPTRWSVASGWSLDLYLGEPSRLHDDLDVAVPRDEQLPLLERLHACGWRLDVPVGPGNGVGGGVYAPWDGNAVPPPAHQVHARPGDDLLGGVLVDLLLTPTDTDAWRYRRDPSVRLPWQRARRVREVESVAVPYLAPEIACLFKIRGTRGGRGKDARDLERVLPTLDAPARTWLREVIAERHPATPWLERL